MENLTQNSSLNTSRSHFKQVCKVFISIPGLEIHQSI